MKKVIVYKDDYKDQVMKLIFDILEGEFGHHSKSGRPDVRNISEFYQKDEKSNFWVALNDNNEVIGTVGLSDCGNNMGYLVRLMVKKEFRRKGIGKELLDTLLDFAKSKGYRNIFLSTSDDMNEANAFYTKNGFERIESPPKEITKRSSWDNIFYKLELKK